ncbi:MAG: hypothetical protein F4103_19555 [Boseongicola sp. SB0673_bin_14]|nr:hypothetical protein [Boseongicola sp. SB0673_bin_14]
MTVRRFGRSWFHDKRSAILIVPSVVAQMARKFVIDAAHVDFKKIKVGLETPIWWDDVPFG